MRPAISVVVPCRDEGPSLAACLDALDLQDFPRDRREIILVDGGSTDECGDMARGRGAVVLADGGTGPAAARNVGTLAARGEIVAYTDADCAPRPDWLTRVAEVFAENPGIAGVAGALRMPRDTFLGRMEDDEAVSYYRGFITSNVAYRRSAILSVGGFDEALTCCEDYDLAWRLLAAGYRIVHDPRPVVVHAPPEVRGSLATYLGKQFWYARNDVPAHARAVRRALRGRDAAAAGDLVVALLPSVLDAALATALVAGVAARAPSVVGISAAGLLASGGLHIGRAAPWSREMPARVALSAARKLVRGVGTAVGCARLLTGAGRDGLSVPEKVPLGPATAAPPEAPSARAHA